MESTALMVQKVPMGLMEQTERMVLLVKRERLELQGHPMFNPAHSLLFPTYLALKEALSHQLILEILLAGKIIM